MCYKLIGLAVAGAAGTLARYGLGGLAQRWLGESFPWGTAVVNVAGCFAFGVVWGLASDRWTITPETRTVILVGFLGAFTTFSTFVSETGQLFSDAEVLIGLGNVAFQFVAGIGVFFFGLAVGRAV